MYDNEILLLWNFGVIILKHAWALSNLNLVIMTHGKTSRNYSYHLSLPPPTQLTFQQCHTDRGRSCKAHATDGLCHACTESVITLWALELGERTPSINGTTIDKNSGGRALDPRA